MGESEKAEVREARAEELEEANRRRTEEPEAGQASSSASSSSGKPAETPSGTKTKTKQLSVSDVLISISFEGTNEPLMLKVWDTEIPEVVAKWLDANKKSKSLQKALARFVQEVEDGAEVF